ncbi:hypothetical protein OR16_32383 [Cupriavidus basilensis OR16]|uniref:DUF1254 domain-containing protein n=1 Tax=Cupriavidus basilensis OR16 TaxID=1127483 RepID=H1SDY2_9BURK|nr:DUF1254 domain-containing protein [Cupriavidus basilensis]EHP39241.1 hypothetical protein OR16_32383 [Cupriavidus basilensis OR16]
MPTVSWYHVWKGVGSAETGAPGQFVIWESLMDAQTLLLTGNSETVYALAAIDLKRDGPTVIEVPPMLLGGVSDLQQKEVVGIGPTGADHGKGGKVLLLPPGYTGTVPKGYIAAKARTYKLVFGVRGFLVDGKPDQATALMKRARIYPLARAANAPQMVFVNGSGKQIDTIFPDTAQYFHSLNDIVQTEPAEIFSSQERFYLASIGIEKGKPFSPDQDRESVFAQAGQLGGAIARDISFASADPERIVYPERRWEWLFIGGSATWDSQGYLNTDRRSAFSYGAIGMSPAMVAKVVGQGSQYLWATRAADGSYLDGGKNYRLRIPANVPVKNFWSLVVYDAQSRSMLRNEQRFPSVSQYTGPAKNADGSVDIFFWPERTAGQGEELGTNGGGEGLVPAPPILRTPSTIL